MTLDLDQIERRAAAASPGPWEADDGDGQYFGVFDPNGGGLCYLAEVHSDGSWDTLPAGEDQYHKANAAFIAHARTDVPALVARVRELEAALKPFAEAMAWEETEGAFKPFQIDDLLPEKIGDGVDLHCIAWLHEDSELASEDVMFTIGDLRRARAALKGGEHG